jgi:arylsulfatase
VNGEKAGGGPMPKTVPISFTSYAGMDVGRDNGLVVDREYEDKAPYAFTGTVKEVVFDLQPAEAAARHAEHEDLHRHAQHQHVAAGAAG